MSFKALTLQLPLPDKVLSPNSRAHWSRKAVVTKVTRSTAKTEALRVLNRAQPPRWEKAKWRAVFFLGKRNKLPDPDNSIASLKAYLDGIADAGIIANDRNLWPERPEFCTGNSMPRVEITITPEL